MVDIIKLLEYLGFWIMFGIIHSLTASQTLKALIPLPTQIYRIFYNIVALISFVWILTYLPSITNLLLLGFEIRGIKQILFLTILVFGAIITGLGAIQWDLFAFLGLAKENTTHFIRNGMYTISRHPVYTGLIIIFSSLLFLGINAAILSWVIGPVSYFIIGSIFEERKLQINLEGYDEYKTKVAWFLPYKKMHYEFIRNNFSSESYYPIDSAQV